MSIFELSRPRSVALFSAEGASPRHVQRAADNSVERFDEHIEREASVRNGRDK
jgi:hypothetical protein